MTEKNLRLLKNFWWDVAQSIFTALGAIFFFVESYEVISDKNITRPFVYFLASGGAIGLILFFVDGWFIRGFLRCQIDINYHGYDTKIVIKFGDIFTQDGWKAIGVNDFFDSTVDEDLVSSNSLHGQTIQTYWRDNHADWQKQIDESLNNSSSEKVNRPKGNKKRYPIGTTGQASTRTSRFLFVALGTTDATNNVTTANAETLICAVRGMLESARAVCSYEPLSIPLMGSGLARVGIKNSFLLDLIIAAILEETRKAKITDKIIVVLPKDKEGQINLKNHSRNWS